MPTAPKVVDQLHCWSGIPGVGIKLEGNWLSLSSRYSCALKRLALVTKCVPVCVPVEMFLDDQDKVASTVADLFN